MRRYLPFVVLLASSGALAQDQANRLPRLLSAQELPVEIESTALQRQYEALAVMSLQTLVYTSQGSVQQIDGDTGIVLPNRAEELKKGDSGGDILQLFKDVLLATGTETLEVREHSVYYGATRHLSFSQSIRGIPVIFGNVSIEYNDDTKLVSGLSATFIPDRNLPVKPVLSAQQAEQAVPHALTVAKDDRAEVLEIDDGTHLGYYVNTQEFTSPCLVWVVGVNLSGAHREVFLVDASTGAIVRREQATEYLTPIVYDVENTLVAFPNIPNQYKLTPAEIIASPKAKQANDNVVNTDTKLRQSFPAAVGNFPQTVKIAINWVLSPPGAGHDLISGTDYLRFSDETQDRFAFGKTLNIVAHEFMHGFSKREIGISATFSDNQSGALAESFSDIMGTVVDISNGADPSFLSSTWVHGNGSYKLDSSKGSRSFMNPKGDSRAVFATVSQDWFPNRIRGVGTFNKHYNSTILSHAYYLLVFGGTHARAADPEIPEISVAGQGETKARNIFMQAFRANSMNNEPTFDKMKTAAMAAATSLYPGGAATNATENAFEAVGICGVSAAAPATAPFATLFDHSCLGQFDASWPAVAGATRYYAEVTVPVLGWAFAAPVSDVTELQCSFQISQDAHYRIQACNDCGCGPWSTTKFLEYHDPCL